MNCGFDMLLSHTFDSVTINDQKQMHAEKFLFYTMPLMIHAWRMVTENCICWKILKCCAWRLILKRCVEHWTLIRKFRPAADFENCICRKILKCCVWPWFWNVLSDVSGYVKYLLLKDCGDSIERFANICWFTGPPQLMTDFKVVPGQGVVANNFLQSNSRLLNW